MFPIFMNNGKKRTEKMEFLNEHLKDDFFNNVKT